MSLRQSISDHKGAAVILAIALAMAVMIPLGLSMKSGESLLGGTGGAWYTVDDGKTWFSAATDKIAPFDHNGKPAYRCYVFSCDRGKTKFVSHLERLHPDVKAKIESGVFDPMSSAALEVKDPGAPESAWVRQADPKAKAITTPNCPNDPSKLGEPVYP